MEYEASDLAYAKENNFEQVLGLSLDTQKVFINMNERVDPDFVEPYAPELDDLVRLHKLVRARKVTTVLEFGVGHSSLVLADALQKNKDEYQDVFARELRRNNLFELHCVDVSKRYIGETRERLSSRVKDSVKFLQTECVIGTFNDRICHFYQKLPNVCPDFIYLDAPHQFDVEGEIGGISIQHPDRLVMSGDILRIEHFLLPGTLILVDGRSANARFLKSNFQRNWSYSHDADNDVHYFELIELPLGKYNKDQIEMCLGKEYFDKLNSAN